MTEPPRNAGKPVFYECGRCGAPLLREQIERRPCGHNTDRVTASVTATAKGLGQSSGG